MSNETEIKLKKPIWGKWWFWLIAIFVIFILIGTSGEEKKETTPEQQLPQEQTQLQEVSQTEEQIAEQQYIQEVLGINQNVSDAIRYITNLCQTKPLPALWTEEEIFTIAAHTVMIELSYESAQELDPPDKFKTTHDFFLSGLSKYAEAMPIFRSGVDNLDADKIQQSTNLIAEGIQFINQATKEVNKIR